MRFLVDASLPRSATAALRSLGHEAIDVRDIGMGGAPDDAIAAHARSNRLVLVTRDFDFADTRNYPPAEQAGIVVLDLPNDTTAAGVARVLEAVASSDEWLALLVGRLAIVEPGRVRFRPVP